MQLELSLIFFSYVCVCARARALLFGVWKGPGYLLSLSRKCPPNWWFKDCQVKSAFLASHRDSWNPPLNCIAGGESICICFKKNLPALVSGTQHDKLCTLGKVRNCMLQLIRYAKHGECGTWNKGREREFRGKTHKYAWEEMNSLLLLFTSLPPTPPHTPFLFCKYVTSLCFLFSLSFFDVPCSCRDEPPSPGSVLPSCGCSRNFLQYVQFTDN